MRRGVSWHAATGTPAGMQNHTPDLVALAAIQDPLGVLSVYIDADPGLAGHERPVWEIAVRNRLGEIRHEVKDGETHDRWTAIEAAIDRLQPRLLAPTDAATRGRGRALFAPLSDHRVEEVRVQVPLETMVVLRDRAYLEPLARALDAGRPTGLVNVSRDGARMVDLRMGVAEDAEWLGFDADTGHWGLRIGSAQRDPFDRALEDHQIRFIGSAAGDVAELAAHLAPALEEEEARRQEGLVREAADRAAANGCGARVPRRSPTR